MLKRAALVVLALATVGCGAAPSEPVGTPEPVTRHLVYQRVIGETGIWIAGADGTNARLLVRDGIAPEISPDGSSVAYLADCGASHCAEVRLVPSSGGKPRLLTRAAWLEGITWSPDSTRIVVTRALLGAATDEYQPDEALLSFDVASGDEAELARGGFWDWSFSPDGKEIVYALAHGPNTGSFTGLLTDLFVVATEGGDKPRQITETGDSGYPVWGPKSIAFAKLLPNRGWGRHEIWEVQPDGSGLKTITGSPPKEFLEQGYVGLVPVDWSDDGRKLFAGLLNEWGSEPVAVEPATGKVRHLGWGTETVALSADGRFALVQAGSGAETPPDKETVLIFPYEGAKPAVVARGAVSPSWNR